MKFAPRSRAPQVCLDPGLDPGLAPGLALGLALAMAAPLLLMAWPGDARADDERLGHRATAWEHESFARERRAAMAFGDDYRDFLAANKTEREVIAGFLDMARKRGYRDLLADERPRVAPGSKLFATRHGKILALIVVGEKPVSEGVHLVAAHVDAVRIDLKQQPLYGDGNLAWLQTQYYGGIKAYQWLSQPLELRGVVVKKDGQRVDIRIGDTPDEPVFIIPDIAAQLSHHVDEREGEEVPGEALDAIFSSTPARSPAPGQDAFAAEAERLLAEQYGLDMGDLLAAELELVPAAAPRDIGIDRALVGGYAQDDRAGSYAAVRALLDARKPSHTAIVMLLDNHEVGAHGSAGARSSFVRRVVAELLEAGGQASTEAAMDRAFSASTVMSADTVGAAHAQYASVYDAGNTAFLGAGVAWDRSAVHAEVMAYVRTLLDQAGIKHQSASWPSAVGARTGESMLRFFTGQGMSGLDVSIPLLSMHAPYEVLSKADLFEAYRAYRAFLAD